MNAKTIPGQEGGLAVGQRKLYTVSGSGPSSYSRTTGDVIFIGTKLYIDDVLSANIRPTVSGTYYVMASYSAANTTRATWTLHWYVTATSTEVANGIDLSAEKVQFTVLGGEF